MVFLGDHCVIVPLVPFVSESWFVRTSATSYDVDCVEAIKASTAPDFLSGLGSSTTSNLLNNPFYFTLQVIAVLLGKQPASYGCYRTSNRNRSDGLGSESSFLGNRCIIVEPFVPFVSESLFVRTSITSHHVDRLEALKAPTAPNFLSGLGGSTTCNMLSNPFYFTLQLSEYIYLVIVIEVMTAFQCCCLANHVWNAWWILLFLSFRGRETCWSVVMLSRIWVPLTARFCWNFWLV